MLPSTLLKIGYTPICDTGIEVSQWYESFYTIDRYGNDNLTASLFKFLLEHSMFVFIHNVLQYISPTFYARFLVEGKKTFDGECANF